jgi:hypothetical protein
MHGIAIKGEIRASHCSPFSMVLFMQTALTMDRGLERRVLGLHKLSEREGFMQTRCHGHSVTKLVRAPHGFSGSAGRVAEREGIHADTLPQPVVKAPQL